MSTNIFVITYNDEELLTKAFKTYNEAKEHIEKQNDFVEKQSKMVFLARRSNHYFIHKLSLKTT